MSFSFKKIELENRQLLNKYFFKYGEDSCQHSFVSSFCLNNKYGDCFYEKDDWLIVYRSFRDNEKNAEYLFPFGDMNDEIGLKNAMNVIFSHSAEKGLSVCFRNITQNAVDTLKKFYSDRFTFEENRDYFEYIYTYDKLANLSGKEMASKRYDVNTFFRDFGDKTSINLIQESDIDEIREFQKYWLSEKLQGEEDIQLEIENEAIKIGLSNFKELGLSGIIVRINGKLCGYAYGSPLSDDCYDVLIEKGDRHYPDIYKVLNRELVRICCESYSYINREEDVGEEGLRKAKLSYKPDILRPKFTAIECC